MHFQSHDTAAGGTRRELLLFRLNGGQPFAVPVAVVKEIRAGLEITPLPNTHPLVRGVSRLRGATFPVVDLQAALGWGRAGAGEGQIVVLQTGEALCGVEVEQVERIVGVAEGEIRNPPPGTGRHPWIAGVVRIERQLVEILNLSPLDGMELP